MARRKDDMLLKSAFEEAFPELLRFVFADAYDIFDFDKPFEFLDKELRELFPELENKGGNRFVDMLVKVFLKNGKTEWILVHIEIQGANDKHFSARMFQYWYRVFDRYKVDITAVAVLTGKKSQARTNRFYKSFLGTEVSYRYNVKHIHDYREEELLKMNNPFALVILAAQKALLRGKLPDDELNRERLMIAKALIESRRYSHERISRFLFFLKQFVHIEDPKINRNFDRQIDELTGKRNTMGIIEFIKEDAFEKGIEKGIKKGKAEGKAEVVASLINTGNFTIEQIANFANVSESFVRKVKKGQLSKE